MGHIAQLRRWNDKKLAQRAIKLYARHRSMVKVAEEITRTEGIKRSHSWVALVVNKFLENGGNLESLVK